ncbi:MAG: hypothetical protein GY851_16685 [bacterium]|nr:hypothetical protein [bacterium]
MIERLDDCTVVRFSLRERVLKCSADCLVLSLISGMWAWLLLRGTFTGVPGITLGVLVVVVLPIGCYWDLRSTRCFGFKLELSREAVRLVAPNGDAAQGEWADLVSFDPFRMMATFSDGTVIFIGRSGCSGHRFEKLITELGGPDFPVAQAMRAARETRDGWRPTGRQMLAILGVFGMAPMIWLVTSEEGYLASSRWILGIVAAFVLSLAPLALAFRSLHKQRNRVREMCTNRELKETMEGGGK